ncbi:hypothetical protein IDH44_15870 [Paenibacillus sp. IB182496]|uniref:Spore germination protein N-terminal domain-containing protein n=1 Tax=Paenibacillus sabuli TaxID=2772509 RepID=A0A927GSV2_9BACL|nr:hypothetical protein [Paenibacillus sabuli]MBD2846676.1 hypothetical protein [Paenibacillus sabuli]
MQNQHFFLSGEGDTLFEAARMIRARSDRKLLWGHTTVVLLNRKLAEQGVSRHIESLRRLRRYDRPDRQGDPDRRL